MKDHLDNVRRDIVDMNGYCGGLDYAARLARQGGHEALAGKLEHTYKAVNFRKLKLVEALARVEANRERSADV